jgi:RES domain-containing protein
VLEGKGLPLGWDRETPIAATQEIGEKWIRENRFTALSVPSGIVRFERNLILNVAHGDFELIQFLPPTPFRFDSRLKKAQK